MPNKAQLELKKAQGYQKKLPNATGLAKRAQNVEFLYFLGNGIKNSAKIYEFKPSCENCKKNSGEDQRKLQKLF